MSETDKTFKNLYYLIPIEFFYTIFHLLFLGRIRSNWSVEFTLIVKTITYWFNLIPLIGFKLFRQVFNLNIFYKFWELRSIPWALPYKSIGGSGIDVIDGLKLEFMWYEAFDIVGWFGNCFSQGPSLDRMRARINTSKSIILYIHGGGFVFGSSNSHRSIILDLSRSTNLPILSVDYRLCPEYKFPTPLIDIVTAYSFLLDKNVGLGLDSSQILIAGDSAGGNLVLTLAYYLRDYKLPSPKGLVLMSPWLDLTQTSLTWKTFKAFDYLQNHTNRSKSIAHHYITTPDLICHPYVSPFYGKVNDLPPILLQYGTLEVLSGEIEEFSLKFKTKNTKLIMESYEDMVHVFQFFSWTQESKLAFKNINKFINNINKSKI